MAKNKFHNKVKPSNQKSNKKKNNMKNKLHINGDDTIANKNDKSPVVNNVINKKENKRKSNESDIAVGGKKQKIDKFPGTSALKDNNVKTAVEGSKKKKEKKAGDAKNTQVPASPKADGKLSKRQKKRAAVQMHKQRVNAVKEKLAAGGNEANNIANELKAIIAEKKKTSELKVSISAAKKLLYFHKHGKDEEKPKKENDTTKTGELGSTKKQKKKQQKQGIKPVPSSDEDDDTKKTNLVENNVQSKNQKKKNKKLKQEIKDNKEQVNVQQSKSKKKNKNQKGQLNQNEDDSDYDVEKVVKVDKVTKKMNEEANSDDEENDDADDIEDDESNEDEESDIEDEDDEEMTEAPKKGKPKKLNVKQNLKDEGIVQKGQSRYVLFVGNIPFDCTAQDLKAHFSKTCEVKDVRFPLEKGTNKPRGFAYVELSNEASYQKGLSLHHSMFNNRRINVLYTQGGKKKGEDSKKVIKVKNLKLQAMRQKGILTSDVKESQKKAARRAKRKKLQPNQQS